MPPQPPPGVQPVVRIAARVVLLDDRDRILLFRWEDERLHDARSIWITPGGGLNAGESPEDGARRELREETGIEAELGPCAWTRTHTFRFGAGWIEQRERYYVVRTPAIHVVTDGLEPHERIAMVEHRLWSVAELAASSEWFAPRRLVELLPPLLRGEIPHGPIEIGA